MQFWVCCCCAVASATGFLFSSHGSYSTIIVNQPFSVFLLLLSSLTFYPTSLFPGLCFSIAYTLLPSLQQSSFLSSLPTFYFLFSAALRRHLDDLLYHGCLTLCLRSPPEQLVGLERSNP